jgi:hypothetical protein
VYLATHRHALTKGRENQAQFVWTPAAAAYSGGFMCPSADNLTPGLNITTTSYFQNLQVETGIKYGPPPDGPFVTRLMLQLAPATYEYTISGTVISSDLGDRPILFGWNQYALDNSNAFYPKQLTLTQEIVNYSIEQDIVTTGPIQYDPDYNYTRATGNNQPDTFVINTTGSVSLSTGDTRFYLTAGSVFELSGSLTVGLRRISSL